MDIAVIILALIAALLIGIPLLIIHRGGELPLRRREKMPLWYAAVGLVGIPVNVVLLHFIHHESLGWAIRIGCIYAVTWALLSLISFGRQRTTAEEPGNGLDSRAPRSV